MSSAAATGSLMAHWLFWQKKTTGAPNLAAKTRASITSPSTGGAVAEVGDRGGVRAVVLTAHRVAGGVQRLRADDHLRRAP